MIAIKLSFLTGRFHATPWGHHVNEGLVEWPPSNFRLLRALVSAYYRLRPVGVTEQSLWRILDALSDPPSFKLPKAVVAHTRQYVPDSKNDKSLLFDTFLAFNREDNVIWYWPKVVLNDDDKAALELLLSAITTFGRSESWCELELLDLQWAETLEQQINCRPLEASTIQDDQERIDILLPDSKGEELKKLLLVDTISLNKDKKLQPNGSKWVSYTRPKNEIRPIRSIRKRIDHSGVTVARFALHSTVLPLIQDSLPFAEKVRRALIRERCETSHSEAITGKRYDGTPLHGHIHTHYLPTDEDGDGKIDHITLYAPCGFDRDDLTAIGQMRNIFRKDNLPNVQMILTGLGSPSEMTSIPIFTAARRWRSVTPFSLPCFANRGKGKPPRKKDLPSSQLIRELALRQLPEPISINYIDHYKPQNRPEVYWLDYHTRRYNGTSGFGLVGFEIEFSEDIAGPLALGFGCHFGLGLFLPVQ